MLNLLRQLHGHRCLKFEPACDQQRLQFSAIANLGLTLTIIHASQRPTQQRSRRNYRDRESFLVCWLL